ncbi:hypothetical protein B0H12DRAFT_1130976 [Mycena haematopus]|nr:hypothetical protein B0H12DRAFT_1130976 [Mycena haematopus]
MHDTDAETARDSALAIHIRHLLLDYVVQHITTNYIELTEQAVVDLWAQYFEKIPTTDPNSLTLPTDPFDTLTRIHGLATLERFQEKFQSTPGAIQLIKRLIKAETGKPKSDRVSLQESSFESSVPVCRPFSPILTTRAIRETPRAKAESPKLLDSLPPVHQEFLSSQGIAPIGVEPILETSVKQDEVLKTNWRLRPEEHDAVRSLLRSVLTGPPKGYKNRHLDFSARPDSPPIPSRIPEPQFIPIFPRRRRVGSGVHEGDPPPTGLEGIASLPAVILPPAEIDELEPELHRQNMVIVDGWQAYRSSPSPTPSPSSSQEDQLDELFMESPDTTPPPVRPTKMDVVLIPRVGRIGGEKTKPLPIGHGTDLGNFLLPHVQKAPTASPASHFSLEPSVSMVGQADSACELTLDIDHQDLDDDVAGLYGHQKQDPRDLILKDKLDEKRQLLMDVPVLPPPNEHPPNALFLPSSLRDFVTPSKAKDQTNVKHPTHLFLKKAKGIPSLNVELSWVPIAAKTRIPTSSEIIKVTSLFDTDLPSTQMAALLGKVPATVSDSELPAWADTWSRRYRSSLSPELDDPDPEISRCEIILSRKERRRVAGLPNEVQDEEMEDSYDALDPEDAPIDDRSAKRPRLSWDECLDDSGIAFDAPSHDSQIFLGDAESYPYDGDKENLLPHDEPYHEYHAPAFPAAECNEEYDPYSAFPAESQRSLDHQEVSSINESREFPTQLPVPRDETAASDNPYVSMFEPDPNTIMNGLKTAKHSSYPPSPDIASHSLGIAAFAKLRAKKITVSVPESLPPTVTHDAPTRLEAPSYSAPENIYDRNTLRLPSPWTPPESLHRYMVSMDLVQKQGLVRCLRSRSCSIDLVERDSLGGVDIILDPNTAIIFTNLLILPSECADLVSRVAQQSWFFSRLLVIFDAYPTAYSYRSRDTCNTASELFAYSPPVIKALGKLRRDLGISEGCGTKRQACVVQYAFADTVEEAAKFTRYFGDFAEANDDSRGMIWGDRAWLDDDVPEGEQDLAAADGMNQFAAYLILCQIDLGEFLELSAEARVEKFGAFVGVERMVRRSCFRRLEGNDFSFCRSCSIRLLSSGCRPCSLRTLRWSLL